MQFVEESVRACYWLNQSAFADTGRDGYNRFDLNFKESISRFWDSFTVPQMIQVQVHKDQVELQRRGCNGPYLRVPLTDMFFLHNHIGWLEKRIEDVDRDLYKSYSRLTVAIRRTELLSGLLRKLLDALDDKTNKRVDLSFLDSNGDECLPRGTRPDYSIRQHVHEFLKRLDVHWLPNLPLHVTLASNRNRHNYRGNSPMPHENRAPDFHSLAEYYAQEASHSETDSGLLRDSESPFPDSERHLANEFSEVSDRGRTQDFWNLVTVRSNSTNTEYVRTKCTGVQCNLTEEYPLWELPFQSKAATDQHIEIKKITFISTGTSTESDIHLESDTETDNDKNDSDTGTETDTETSNDINLDTVTEINSDITESEDSSETIASFPQSRNVVRRLIQRLRRN
ncbi:uncharacterized protein LOC106165828 [Lingula anatina]|uniref:Uncharacterized protein LOC106165828 n=1 Tax=Lingula anatina TaxID=7574 RepID=A0A1S3IP75_LINAN|nr:uncharacterized protein LOC106165828 [Lingula anatina]|eukprot:XP_013400012.1 uncharacterized protein LOC106165828 [Lingula anatina]